MDSQPLPALTTDLIAKARRSESKLAELPADKLAEVHERYLRFLLLIKLFPQERLAPTTDIDEMWHLHMLDPRGYATDCQMLFGDLLDHDAGYGKTPEERPVLEQCFENTKGIWEKTFGQPYITQPDIHHAATCPRQCVKVCRKTCNT